MKETFHKTERLCSHNLIAGLLKNGESFTYQQYRIIWQKTVLNTNLPAQVAFSVSKKRFKKAVDRNKIKRRLKESYRKNKYVLYNVLNEKNCNIIIMIIFYGDKIPGYIPVENAMTEIIKGLSSRIGR